jgi:molybdenum cofactor sulfurtransferase
MNMIFGYFATLDRQHLRADFSWQAIIAERQVRRSSHQSLFALSGESEATGYRPNLKKLLSFAKGQGFDTLLDAEALAPTSRISLRNMEGTVDAMAVTFHKMFGYPTGAGALIARRDFLARLKRLYHLMLQNETRLGAGSSAKDDTSLFERFEVRFN